MWLLFRLVALAFAFVLRWIFRRRFEPLDRTLNGITHGLQIHEQKGRVVEVCLGVPLDTELRTRFSKESQLDRFFKWAGLATEFQTGDSAFDAEIYVACDRENVHRRLALDPAIRAAVQSLVHRGYHRIEADGRALWAITKRHQGLDPEGLSMLDRLRASLAALSPELANAPRDPFVLRAFVAEAASWAVASAAVVGLIRRALESVPSGQAVFGTQLFLASLRLSGVAALVMLVVLFLAFRGSARGHRILAETGLLTSLSLPAAGYQLYEELNRDWDDAPPIVWQTPLSNKHIESHGKRRGVKRYSFHIEIDPPDEPGFAQGETLSTKVSEAFYKATPTGTALRVEIGRGRFGHPWFRSISSSGS